MNGFSKKLNAGRAAAVGTGLILKQKKARGG